MTKATTSRLQRFVDDLEELLQGLQEDTYDDAEEEDRPGAARQLGLPTGPSPEAAPEQTSSTITPPQSIAKRDQALREKRER